MIDKIFFQLSDGEMLCSDDYGLILKSFDAPPPKPKIYRVSVDGADGDLDMTEWAGTVRYENREVLIAFRDMTGTGYKGLLNALHGRTCKIIHSADEDFYFQGRCEDTSDGTRRRITDAELTFVCSPYKVCRYPTKVQHTVSSGTQIMLKAARRASIPTITLTAQCTLTWNGTSYTKEAGTHIISQIVITDTPTILTVSGSGTITVQWTEGVL